MVIKNILIVYKGSFLMIFDSVELLYNNYVFLCITLYLWNSWISLTWQDVVGRVRQAGDVNSAD